MERKVRHLIMEEGMGLGQGKQGGFKKKPNITQMNSPKGRSGSLSTPRTQGQGMFSSPPSIPMSSPDPVGKHPINLNPRPWPEASRKT